MALRKRRGARERRGADNSPAPASSALGRGVGEVGEVRGKVAGGKQGRAAKKKLKAKAKPAAKAKAKPAAKAKAKAKAKPAAKAKPKPAAKAKAKPAAKAKAKPAAKAKAKPAVKAKAKAKPAAKTKLAVKAARAAAKAAREKAAKAAARAAARAAAKAAAREAEERAEKVRLERLAKARARARARAAEKKRLAEEAEKRRLEKAKRERRRRLDAKRRLVFEAVFKREVKAGSIALPKRGKIFEKGGAFVGCHQTRLFRSEVRDKAKTESAFVKKLAREVEAYARKKLGEQGKKSKFKFWIALEFLAYRKGNLRGDTVNSFPAPKVSRVVVHQHYQSKPVTYASLGKRAEWLFDQVSKGSELLLFSVCVGAIPPAEDERARQRRILRETFKRLKASGDIEIPKGSQIVRNDNYGESFTISRAVELTLPDLVEQMDDVVALCVDSADELNDFIRALPDAVQAQALPRFWTTYEFLVFDRVRRRGSPKTFFISTDKGKEEIALSYDGHPQVYFDEYESAVRAMFEEVVRGPEVFIFAIHVGGTFKGLKKKRRRKRGNRRKGRRGQRVARRADKVEEA